MRYLSYNSRREDCRDTISHINAANLTPAVVAMVLGDHVFESLWFFNFFLF